MNNVNIGIVGCGNISKVYLKNLKELFNNTKVVSLADLDSAKATLLAEQFSVQKAYSFDEMLADQDVAVVLNLTVPKAHYPLSKAALLAGKHVYVEKPLALTYKEAKELCDIAREKKLFIGAATDTFLGAGYQTAKALIDAGVIGKITSALTFDLCHGHENWHPDPEFFYEAGGGPLYDRGPYNLSALISLIGPARRVAGITSMAFTQRTISNGPKFGKMINVEIPTHISGTIQFESGAVCTIASSFDVWGTQIPKMEIHGTLGSMILPDPNSFGGPVLLRPRFASSFTEVPLMFEYADNSRGLGLSDMANCILGKSDQLRASGEMACHVVEIMEALHVSSEDSRYVNLESTCMIPKGMMISTKRGDV